MTFTADRVQSFRGSRWRTDRSEAIQGDWGGYGINTGAWFYGKKITNALHGATILKFEIFMSRESGGSYAAQQPTVWLHNHESVPAGAPSLQGGTDYLLAGLAVGNSGWLTNQTWCGQALANGTSKGIACYTAGSSPYIVFSSLAQSRSSGAIRLTYRR
jgi:hypothetical protein